MPSSDPSIKHLFPEDYLLIEKEHKQLDRFLSDLRDTCCNLENLLACNNCDKEKLASCQGRLPSFIYRLLETTGKHYFHEESIMLSRPHITEQDGYFRAHRQAHVFTMEKLKAIADESTSLDQQGLTAECYRLMYNKVSSLFDEHNRSFDIPFIQSTH